jgi:NAD+ kinase
LTPASSDVTLALEAMLVKKIGILYHPMVQATCLKAEELTRFLNSRGIGVWSCSAWETENAISRLNGTDLLLTTGGDGTILRAAQVALQHQIPITGINMGNLGFLTEFKADEAVRQLSEILDGQGWIDERTMLQAQLVTADQNGNPPGVFTALNDVVLARGAIAKLIQINTSINDQPLAGYRADGLILSTATGSTGYALAAGGPILFPQSGDLLLVPIVSHLSSGYSQVLPASSVIKLQLATTNQGTLSIDGHINIPVFNGAVVTIRSSSKKTRFLRLRPRDYFFQVLEEKLRGKK